MSPFHIAFGANIRALRQERGFSQAEMAHAAGIHVTYLSGIERGRRNPSLSSILKISNTLGIPVRDLFSFEEPSA